MKSLVLMVGLALPLALQAQSLTLQDAVEKSLAQHPRLAVDEFREGAAQARLKQSRIGSKPELNLTVEDALGSGVYSGTDSAQITLSIAWVLEGTLLQSRESAALSEQSVVRSETKARRLDVAAETARRFMHALLLQQRSNLVRASVQQSTQTLKQIQRRVDIGQSSAADALRAEARLAEVQLLLEDVEHETRVAYRELAASWGVTSTAFDRLSGDFSGLGVPVSFEALTQTIDSNPSLMVLSNRERLAQSKVALTKAEARSRWKVSTGVRHYGLEDDVAVVAGLSLPLGGEGRSRDAIEAAALGAQATAAEKDALRIELLTQLFALHEQWLHAIHVSDSLQDKILPLLRKAMTETRRAYERGKAGFLELANVQAELLEAEGRLLDSQHRAHLNRIEIERLIGVPLTGLTQ